MRWGSVFGLWLAYGGFADKASDKTALRAFIKSCLEENGDRNEFDDHESPFIGGRLASLAVTQLVVFLEEHFGIDFAEVDFDVEILDSAERIEALVSELTNRKGAGS
jgi:acyl carrier protein